MIRSMFGSRERCWRRIAAAASSIEEGRKIAVLFDAGWYLSGKGFDEGRQVSGRYVHLTEDAGDVGKVDRQFSVEFRQINDRWSQL